LNEDKSIKKKNLPWVRSSLETSLQMQGIIDNSEKIINLDYLTKIANGNVKFVNEMVKIFLTENPDEIKALEKAIVQNNFEGIKIAANKLRSTIPFFGLDKVIEKDVIEIEALATNKLSLDEIKTLFSKVKRISEMACIELQSV
jgi:HPt (histidine-containing phosphotransfer) domain-containing protein